MDLSESAAKHLFDTQALDELVARAGQLSQERFDNKIRFFAPSFIKYSTSRFSNQAFDYPAISVTGVECALDCDHCGKQLLESMIHASTPQKLLETCRNLERQGARGCLISGGADSHGRVPLKFFLRVIKQVKEETGLTLAVHTGLVEEEVASGLGDAGVDVALIDVIGDRETIERVYHIKAVPEDFLQSMKHLKNAGLRLAPHVVVGLNYGVVTGEFRALEMMKEARPDAVVLVGLMPLTKTRMESTAPPKVEEFGKVIGLSRLMLPDTPLILGCARDRKTKHVLDPLAVKSGVNGIAHPHEEAVREAERLGLDVAFHPTCCAEIVLSLK